jgi:hydrogenase maturation factor HypF (carbamoyltransferase family)
MRPDQFERPTDRRFHAEAMACPRCRPQVRLMVAKAKGKATAKQ